MKFKLIIPILLLFSFSLKSQDISVNPILLLFEGAAFSGDYNINNDFAVGADLLVAAGGSIFYLNGKHYFSPKLGNDRWMVGSFAGFSTANIFTDESPGIGLGFFFGYKWVSRRNVTFELAYGVGRDFSGEAINLLPYFKANIGYRFKKKNTNTDRR